ncbi:substrate-binding domain-containing protein [Bradyrhizobium cosmicum]|uniref:substrate-binding domain-containing protein n=1 Tax=Bradyrhizobium cosmicum TaxID=1404864 RepID=UPI0028EF2E70|nr:substrate-binding domain-containing protein [Bradyrhizobium cosmicum]
MVAPSSGRGVAIFDELTQGLQELEFLADPTVGLLRIGSSENVAAGLLPAVIDRFSRQHPGIRLDVSQAVLSTTQYRELRERSIDLLLGWIPTPFAEEDLVAERVVDDPGAIVAGTQSKWARLSKIALSDLADEAWILPPADTFPGAAAARLFREVGLSLPRTPLTTLSIHLCCRLAATGRFVTMLPSSIVRFGGRDLSLKILPGKATPKITRAGGCCQIEEPHPQSGGREVHRMRSRSLHLHGWQAAGSQMTNPASKFR